MSGITKQKRLERTAFHEAGHAIACIGVRKAFKNVTIVPSEEYAGVIQPHRKWLNFDPSMTSYDWDPKELNRIRKDIFISLGGPAAASIHIGRAIRRNWNPGSDHDNVLDVLDALYAGLGLNEDIDKEVGKYISYMELVVKNYLIRNWKFVEWIANNLLSFKTLSYQKVKNIVYKDRLSIDEPKAIEKIGAIEPPIIPWEAKIL